MEQDATILRLPYHCLRHIFLLLEPKDYEQLRHVCQSFEQLAIACWRSKYKHWTRRYTNGDDAATLKWVVHNLSDFLEEINLDYLHIDDLRLFEQAVFPKTTALKAASNCGINDTEILARAFPNLNKLTLDGNIDLDVIAEMHNLKELSCYIYGHKEQQTFKKIFRNLKLEKLSINYADDKATRDSRIDFMEGILHCAATLNELSLEGRLLDWIIPLLGQLPKLQTLALINSADCDERTMFERVANVLGTRIRTLVSEQLCDQFAIEQLHAMNVRYLEKFISKDRNLKWTADVRSISAVFGNLRELQFLGDYIHSRLDTNEDDDDDDSEPLPAELMPPDFVDYDPMHIIVNCPLLEILAVPREWINERLMLNVLLEHLRETDGNSRKLPLELRCLENVERNKKSYKPLEFEVNTELLRITRATYPEEYKCTRSCCLSFQIVLDS